MARRPAGLPRFRSRLTGRAAVLALAVCALVIAVAYPLRNYLAQRGQLDALRTQLKQQQDAVSNLQQQQQDWQDPAYVGAQARRRLHYADPGETPFVVLPPSSVPTSQAASPTPTPKAAAGAAAPAAWYETLVTSAETASGPAAVPTPDSRTSNPPPPARPAPRTWIGPSLSSLQGTPSSVPAAPASRP